MTKRQYTVIFERGKRPNQWLASVKELPECHTFGRGLAQTRARIREALVLWEGDEAASAELVEILPLPTAARQLRKRLRDLQAKLEQTLREREAVVTSLRAKAWSVRDLAEIFDLSHQRIGQMSPSKRKPRRRSMTSSR